MHFIFKCVQIIVYIQTCFISNMQVYCNLQPLNICLSLTGTMNIVKKISEGYNMAVLEWQDDLTKRIIKPQHNVSIIIFKVLLKHTLTKY